jgi:hypothetical protein
LVYCKKRCSDNQDTRKGKTSWSYIENGNEEPVEKYDGNADIGRSPPRNGKRGAVVRDLAPVEGENTHGESMCGPKELVDLGIVWSYPANPRKVREGNEEVGGQEV